ncbi:LacI family DNA-binding transcriptional regulator [Flavobacterium sp. RSSA_27]|uniref:LacI family DNA-binding transcriptional regulator n=1 Tax=Flavobacterium sp. RSSA_27 TaxID=3447667 RepID=UPI003F2F707E
MDQKTTIYDIAKKLDITAATVSRALNNNPKISEATRDLVMETATKMNYKQNRLAQSLRSGKSNNVGVIVPRIDSNFFATVIRGIEEELHPEGYHVIICQTHEDEKREIENITTLMNAQVDGILMSISNMSKENDPVIKHVVDKNVPLIFFDRKKKMDGVSSVTIDDFEGGYLATKNLIDAGCTQIAHFSGDRSLEIYENRFKGYEQALKDFGLEMNTDYVIHTKSNVDAGRNAVTKLLSLPNPPNAIFSSSDFAALGAIQELKEKGIKIPEDFCVFGFGNEPFTRFLELSISSVDQSPLVMGRMAAKVFLEQINNRDNIKIEKKVVLKPELKIRKSSTI